MKKNLSKYAVLLLLVLLFAAPGVAAYFFYKHPEWLAGAPVNKGVLLKPAVLLKALPVKNAKWHVIYWTPETCTKHCFKELDTLARVRLALGRKLYYVDLWLLAGGQEALSKADEEVLRFMDYHYQPVTDESGRASLTDKPRVFLANPDNFLILSYPADVNPNDVYNDLKLLVSASDNKKG